ncbi:PREDICTED: U3 small nucleolar ribonucleoprotein protein MPP10-like [Amphimedon queenslandica]|uniref:U3 small nucleolar ribonucleoprotein protein MPP10 n=1 Tax=Amphimedon queenslandica TaxID=400682 RepID=A0A1X7U1Q7_AMPQE|nr:PREDICTED: U3 small nucleolar ribonucleoprotein protein MPP10-like [Amphimedon queenslandica]|eukprot:XP_003389197.1 PREDICTED: U3 small nucleolar ribonucleoprotein protein MPP10-like [Amphimedon queenslandica]
MSLSSLSSLLSKQPIEFISSSPELKELCLSSLKESFAQVVGSVESSVKERPCVQELHTEGFGLVDIWEQLELVNDPLLKHLKKHLKTNVNHFLSEVDDNNNKTSEADDIRSDNEEMIEEEEEEEELLSEDEGIEEMDSEDPESDVASVGGEVGGDSDQFFDLNKMEEFLKEAEKMDEGSDEDDIDLFDSDAGEGSNDEEEQEEEDEDAKRSLYQYYDDFFDPAPSSTTKTPSVDQPLSLHQKKQEKMKSYIAKLEATNIAEKPWQMTGEVTSKGRGENTLLEEDLMFKDASRPAPEITEEVTLTLEEIIKQRIKDQAWDDVIRKTKPKERPFNYKVFQPLNEEKSQLSLAEVYEQEYIKQTQGEREEEENPKHKEIRELVKKLFNQLDSLSNYHFTPTIAEPEVKSIPLLPSISMEEVAPITHSETTLRAPEEIETPSQVAPVGETERSSTDKKRQRRHKKKRQHAIALSKEKKKALKALSVKLKKTSATRSSNRFFAGLEKEAKVSLKKEKSKLTNKLINLGNTTHTSSGLKL